jgi:hypothetical protein
VNFASITLCVAFQRVFIVVFVVSVYFVIDLVRKLLETPDVKSLISQPIAGNVMLTFSWDYQGPVSENFQECDATINTANYIDLLLDKVKLAVRSKRQGQLSQGVVLLLDSVRPHTAAHTV